MEVMKQRREKLSVLESKFWISGKYSIHLRVSVNCFIVWIKNQTFKYELRAVRLNMQGIIKHQHMFQSADNVPIIHMYQSVDYVPVSH